jgi:hypothetical protein
MHILRPLLNQLIRNNLNKNEILVLQNIHTVIINLVASNIVINVLVTSCTVGARRLSTVICKVFSFQNCT